MRRTLLTKETGVLLQMEDTSGALYATGVFDSDNPKATVPESQLLGTINDPNVVTLTGNQTVAGIKTFSSSPVVPTPTTDFQAATKKYVDDNSGGGGGPASSVLLSYTAAQLLASGTPAQVAAGPGAGKVVVPTLIVSAYRNKTTPYMGGASAQFIMWYGDYVADPSFPIFTLNDFGLLSSADAWGNTQVPSLSSFDWPTNCEGLALNMAFAAIDVDHFVLQNPTAGDGTLGLVIAYSTVQVPTA